MNFRSRTVAVVIFVVVGLTLLRSSFFGDGGRKGSSSDLGRQLSEGKDVLVEVG